DTALQLQDPAAAARLYGRLGAVLAEQNQISDAIAIAEQALKLGREQENWPLVGEQQILLAFALAEHNEISWAREYCQQAIATFEQTGESDQLAKAHALLAELEQLATAR